MMDVLLIVVIGACVTIYLTRFVPTMRIQPTPADGE